MARAVQTPTGKERDSLGRYLEKKTAFRATEIDTAMKD